MFNMDKYKKYFDKLQQKFQYNTTVWKTQAIKTQYFKKDSTFTLIFISLQTI